MYRSSQKLGPILQIAVVCLVWVALAMTLPTPERGSADSNDDRLRSHVGGPRFVFADLDGDRKPDLALVEMQAGRSASNYSIRFKMSAGQESAIGVDAPIGGLKLSARDVNGDDAIDLIVTSNLDVHFIKVLLNDGRGNFSVAPPSDFPRLTVGDDIAFRDPGSPRGDRTTLTPLRDGFGDAAAVQRCQHDPIDSSSPHLWSKIESALQRVVMSRPGRSPPSAFVLS